jgi:quercetin dioxygenase-like cupin family protein
MNKILEGVRELENTRNGERIVFTRSAAETGGEYVAFDLFLTPRGGVPFEHYHHKQSESFRMVRGKMRVRVNGEDRVLEAGDEVTLPPGTKHSLENIGDEEVYCQVQYRPALHSEWFLKAAHGFEEEVGREASILELAPFLARGVEIWPANMPRWVGRLAMPLFAAVGRLLGKDRFVEETVTRHYQRAQTSS